VLTLKRLIDHKLRIAGRIHPQLVNPSLIGGKKDVRPYPKSCFTGRSDGD
jgi:hypothetical protein